MIQLDHVVISVSNLEEAMEDYRRLSFNVLPGGEHASGTTHNALVGGGWHRSNRWLSLAVPQRTAQAPIMDFCIMRARALWPLALRVDDLAATHAELSGRGVSLKAPSAGGRARPDGESHALEYPQFAAARHVALFHPG